MYETTFTSIISGFFFLLLFSQRWKRFYDWSTCRNTKMGLMNETALGNF